MSDLIQAVKGTALSVAEYFTPVLKQSKFRQTGVITPEEFVIAGDHLVHHCPTWSWSPASSASHRKLYLPADKQYLVTKSVPCYKRCKDIENCNTDEKVIMTENDEEGWVDTHHSGDVAVASEMIEDMCLNDDGPSTQQSIAQNKINAQLQKEPPRQDYSEEEEDCEAEDMDKFMNMVDDDDTAIAPVQPSRPVSEIKTTNETNAESNRVPTRTYDLNITYDKYYQTPRLWLVGYDENLKPLSIDEMYEDISQDHAKKTVTMEMHPHIQTVMASVHPCRHAEVMKKIISAVEDGGKELEVYSYLIIFLKLVQSVIPTLEYDFTQNFTI